MKKFKMTHNFFRDCEEFFTEEDAPEWLTSCNTIRGSTMDMRWFWFEHVPTLNVNEEVLTDFRTITRIK